jgi:hypothetical protein
VPRLRRSPQSAIVTQPFRAGLTFSTRASGPLIRALELESLNTLLMKFNMKPNAMDHDIADCLNRKHRCFSRRRESQFLQQLPWAAARLSSSTNITVNSVL